MSQKPRTGQSARPAVRTGAKSATAKMAVAADDVSVPPEEPAEPEALIDEPAAEAAPEVIFADDVAEQPVAVIETAPEAIETASEAIETAPEAIETAPEPVVPEPAEAAPVLAQADLPTEMPADVEPVPPAAVETVTPVETKTPTPTINLVPGIKTMMKSTEDFVAFGQANIEAFVKSSQIWTAGVQDLTKQFATTAKASFDESVSTFKALSTVKSVKEAMELQSTFAKTSMEKAIAESNKLTDASIKLTEQALAPITARVTTAVETFSKAA